MAHIIKTDHTQTVEARTLQILEDFQAADIVTINLPKSCGYADQIIVATGRSSRQMVAIAHALKKELSPSLTCHIHVEGLDKSEWVLIDIGDIIIHLFRPDIRDFYQLEKLWADD